MLTVRAQPTREVGGAQNDLESLVCGVELVAEAENPRYLRN